MVILSQKFYYWKRLFIFRSLYIYHKYLMKKWVQNFYYLREIVTAKVHIFVPVRLASWGKIIWFLYSYFCKIRYVANQNVDVLFLENDIIIIGITNVSIFWLDGAVSDLINFFRKVLIFASHSSLGSRSNPKIKNHPETIWNLVWLCTVVEKKQFGKIFIGGPLRLRKFKNLVKK